MQDKNEHAFHSIGRYLKQRFQCRVVKLSLHGGFTCPNRDGTKGLEGCVFCSAAGSGDMASDVPSQMRLLEKKWPGSKYLAYFQSYTNTYGSVERLRETYEKALAYPDVVGLAVATRPDCLSPEILDLLADFSEKTFLWVELGLQTIHADTAERMNRCYPLSVYDRAVKDLRDRHIPYVTHLIFGLPGETRAQMLDSVRYVCREDLFGIKLHMLNVVRGSAMEQLYPDYVPFASIEEYVALAVDALTLIPPEVTIHRLSGDAPRATLIAPAWSYKKRTILNGIEKELRRRGVRQGANLL